MLTRAGLLPLLLALTAGCSVSRDANPAERCESPLDCAIGFECRYGFCIDSSGSEVADGGVPDEVDVDFTDVTQPDDIGSGVIEWPAPSPFDAGVVLDAAPALPVAEPDAAAEPTPSEPTPSEPTPPAPPPPPVPEGPRCKSSEMVCGGSCVNLLKDSKHCGGCGHKCEKGGCTAGKCDKGDDEGDDDDD